MKTVKNHRARLVSIIAALCLVLACVSLVACGGGSSSSSSAASSSATSSSAASSSAASSKAASPSEQIVGTWKVAAAEQNGLILGGNFGQLLGVGDNGGLTFNADGTGTLTLNSETYSFTWTAEDNGTINVAPQSENAIMKQSIVPVTIKDGAVFMTMEDSGQQGNLIFTKDGTYDKAKQISMADAKPITSEAALLGTWTMVGMNMGGISAYGDAESLKNAMGGTETSVTFKQGGVAELSDGTGSWAIDANGATLTSSDITGTHTVPVMQLGNEIAIDYTEAYGGTEFIFVFAKA